MGDSKFVESGNIRIYEYPNGAEIVKLCSKLDSFVEVYDEAIFIKTKEEAQCIIESLTRYLESFND